MQNYTTIIGVIELRIQGHSYSTVQQRYSVGSSTAQLIMKRYNEYGLSLQTLKEMQPHKVEALFYPKEYMQRRPIPLPDFESYYQRMNERGSKLNLSYFWIEYKEKHPEYSGVAEPPCPVKIEPHRPLNRATMSSGESQERINIISTFRSNCKHTGLQ